MNIDYISIGSRIRQARQSKGLTQSRLAELLEVTPEYISRMERASTKPSLPTLSKIAGLLNVSLTYLLEGATISSADYKLEEFAEILKEMPASKRKLLYDFALLLLQSE